MAITSDLLVPRYALSDATRLCGISAERLRSWQENGVVPASWRRHATMVSWLDLLVTTLLGAYSEQTPAPERTAQLAALLFRVVDTGRACPVDIDILPTALIHAHLRQADLDGSYRAAAARFSFDPSFALFSSYAEYRGCVDPSALGPDERLRAAIDHIAFEDVNDLELFCDLANPYYLDPDEPQDVVWAVYVIEPAVFVSALPEPGASLADPADGTPALAWTCLALGAAVRALAARLRPDAPRLGARVAVGLTS